MKDRGGWRSKGVPIRCPACGEMGMQLETTIYGQTRVSVFCNTCSHQWVEAREVEDVGR